MTITNGYATLAQAKDLKRITSTDTTDDATIELMIEDASRLIDAICNRWFYAYTQTRYFSVPASRELRMDTDLLAITTLTNGNDDVITSGNYHLLPKNVPPYYAVLIKDLSTVIWQPSTSTGSEWVISIAGTWGYVDRSATDPVSVRVIDATRRACLEIVEMWYEQRFGENTGGVATVTGAGVVITPQGAIPKSAWQLIAPFIRRF